MRRSLVLSFVFVSLVVGPALADKKKKGEGDSAPAPAPAETEKPAKKKKPDANTPPPAPPAETEKSAKKKKDKTPQEAEKPKDPPPAPAAPAPGTGTLKPGQAVGVRQCRGSSAGINVDATSSDTYGVAHCRSAIEKMLVDKGLCAKATKGTKLKYSWQFADTTGDYDLYCR